MNRCIFLAFCILITLYIYSIPYMVYMHNIMGIEEILFQELGYGQGRQVRASHENSHL